ncbi:ATP-dependent DNA helicase [Leifsonia sp. H3M29-4]|uniref:ATP-dependent DNA helicase n=1 Tax=Salinibacterium metalliresistens TaxID=3031321 RepID=UPI0023D9A2A9|nr:ATP-dependent DNA helicase [Salinibacterium metalliresistens]MDF1479539.1 ATP-dependent DNA helicase [Salinibacterium metalliresistens]
MAITGFEASGPADPIARGVVLDPSQRAVIELPDAASAAVLGAPGTGKTTTLVELIADRVLTRGWGTDQVLALTTSRSTASRLRDAIALRLQLPTSGPMARSVNSLAFELARDAARVAGAPPPRLITGGEQDADIADLLEGHLVDGTGPHWPAELGPEVRALGRFRSELRELMMRAVEYDVSTDELARLGRDLGHGEWVAAAAFIDEYLAVRALAGSAQLDGAELSRFAVAAIESAEAPERITRLRLVVVDDLQEATESTIAVLRALADRGIAVVVFGDPDVAANSFRGGEPDALGRLASVLGVPGLSTHVLTTAHRQGAELRAFTASVTSRVGAAAAGTQRAAVAGGVSADLPLARVEAPSQARALAAAARLLRERHLEHGVAWRDLAVVVRSNAQVPAIVRALAMAEVPTRTSAAGTPLREDPAARALLTVVDVGIGRTAVTPAIATELLLGPFGGLDRLGLRRLRIALRAEEVAGGGNRPADELIVEALSAPGRFATIDARIGRAAERLAETLALVGANGGSIEELLWLAWDRSGLARTWYDQAIGGGLTATDANRNLDGVLALFTAAKRYVERWPGTPPTAFLANVLDAEVAEDTLSPQAADEAVLVTTPSGAVGLEFDTVVVAGLQDGAWPNLRLRGSLLHPQQLVRAVTGVESSVVDERRQVLGDELRMLALAISRARSRVVLAAVANDDEPASVFLQLLPAGTPVVESVRLVPMTLRGWTGELRRRLVDARGPRRAEAAASLAALAAEGLPGADPADWHGLLPISSTAPLYEDEPVPVSPSAIEKLLDSPLDWFLERTAGSESGVIANVGTIVHWAMETAADQSAEGLWAAVEQRWSELLFEAPWLAERQRRIARGFTDALAEYLDDFARAGKSLVGAESRFKLEVDRAVLSGSIDRVERAPDGSVVIVDLKTGTPTTRQSDIDAHPQLGAYQLAYAEGILDEALAEHGEHIGGGAKLLFVKEGLRERKYREGVQAALDEEGLEAFRERVRAAAMLIAAAEFEGELELSMFGRGDPSRLRLHRVRAVSSD